MSNAWGHSFARDFRYARYFAIGQPATPNKVHSLVENLRPADGDRVQGRVINGEWIGEFSDTEAFVKEGRWPIVIVWFGNDLVGSHYEDQIDAIEKQLREA